MQTFTIACIISVLWFLLGYSLAFSPGSPLIGGSSRFWLIGSVDSSNQKSPNRIGIHTKHSLNCMVPETVFIMFEGMFAVITAAIVYGSVAERMKFSCVVVFIFFWHFVVYCPVAHWAWAPDGFLFVAGYLDYAGGGVVHIAAGVSALAATLVVGPRRGFGVHELKPHNVLYTMIGGSLLWVGWFGFNAGSAGAADGRAGFALMATQISAGTGGVAWMLTECAHGRPPTVLGIVRCGRDSETAPGGGRHALQAFSSVLCSPLFLRVHFSPSANSLRSHPPSSRSLALAPAMQLRSSYFATSPFLCPCPNC